MPRAALALSAVEEILRPPRLVSVDGGFDLLVVPGPVIIRAAYPGCQVGEAQLEVPAGGLPQPVTVRLREKSASA